MVNSQVNTLDSSRPYDVVCFGAHPDDVEMAVAGTVAGFVEAGLRVAFVALTGGEIGSFGSRETRAVEAAKAAKVLGVDLAIFDHPDGALQDNLENRHQLAKILRELKPSIALTPYPYTRAGAYDGRANVDHIACGILVREATKLARLRNLMPEIESHLVRRLYYYMVPDHVKASVVVDVTEHRDKIVASIEAYDSQMKISRGSRTILDILMLGREHLGLRIGVDLAEAFVSEDLLCTSAQTMFEL